MEYPVSSLTLELLENNDTPDILDAELIWHSPEPELAMSTQQ